MRAGAYDAARRIRSRLGVQAEDEPTGARIVKNPETESQLTVERAGYGAAVLRDALAETSALRQKLVAVEQALTRLQYEAMPGASVALRERIASTLALCRSKP